MIQRSPSTEAALHTLTSHLGDHLGGNVDLRQIYHELARNGVQAERFTRRRLWLKRVELIHIYWPEWTIRRGSGWLARLDARLTILGLTIAKRRGSALCWTLNNVVPHEVDGPHVTSFFQKFAGLTDLAICHSATLAAEFVRTYPALGDARIEIVAPCGYGDTWRRNGQQARQAVRADLKIRDKTLLIGMLGSVRRYKGYDRAIAALEDLKDEDVALLIAGGCNDPVLASELEQAARQDSRISLRLRFLSEPELPGYFGACDWLLMCNRGLNYSGSAMLALTIGTPILASKKPPFDELAEMFGTEWVRTFDSVLRTADLADLRCAAAVSTSSGIVRRSWADVGAEYAKLFVETVRARRSGAPPESCGF